MPFQRPNNQRPVIDKETGEVIEIKKVETDRQRLRNLEKEARQEAIQEEQQKKKRGSIHHDYMPEAYPWESIRNWFVRGAPDQEGAIHYPTIQDIVNSFHVNYTRVRNKILEEKWVDQRVQWQASLQKKIQQTTFVDYVEAAAKFDATCIEASQRAMEEILDKFHEAKANGDQVSNLDLDRLGRSAVSWQRVGRLALGLSTDNTASRIETKSGDTLSSIDLTALSDEEIEQMKMLLQRAEIRTQEQTNYLIEGQVTEIVEEPKTSEGSL